MDKAILEDPKMKLAFVKETHHQGIDPAKASWSELHTSRSGIAGSLEDMMKRCDNDKRDMTDNETLAYNYGMQLIHAIQGEFAMRESHGTKDPVDLNKPLRSVPFPQPYSQRTQHGQVTERTIRMAGECRYAQLFGDPGHETEFRDAEEFFEIVLSRRYDPRLEKRAMMEGIGAQGGFAVPQSFAATIYDRALESEIVRPRSIVYPITQGNEMGIPAWQGADHTSGGLYGLAIQWLAEGQAANSQDATLRALKMTANKGAIFCDASNELMLDGISMSEQIGTALSKTVGFGLDYVFINGNGVGKALGVLNADSSLIKVGRAVTSQISYDDLVNMFARFYPPCYANSVWLISPATIPQLANVRDAGNNNLWIQSSKDGVPTFIFGRPVIVTEKVPTLGAMGDVLLVDFSQYGIAMRKEIGIDISNAPRWSEDMTSFRCIVRVDGKPLWDKPVTPANGGATLSWAVALDVP